MAAADRPALDQDNRDVEPGNGCPLAGVSGAATSAAARLACPPQCRFRPGDRFIAQGEALSRETDL
jgi:hypothetical protein